MQRVSKEGEEGGRWRGIEYGWYGGVGGWGGFGLAVKVGRGEDQTKKRSRVCRSESNSPSPFPGS